MEPITHFLTGACLSRAGFNRKTALATLTMTLAAEAPDLDVLYAFGGRVNGFQHHRGWTHTFLGIIFTSGLAVLVAYGWNHWRHRAGLKPRHGPPPRWGLLFALAYLAGLSHLLLDFTNNYGLRPFIPFSYRWYSWDIVFIVEPLLWVFLLLIGLLVPALFSLVDREIGAGEKGPRGRVAAITALALMASLWGLRDIEHRRAIAAVNSLTYQNEDPVRVSAYPYYVNPFRWYAVVETRDLFESMDVDSLDLAVDPTGQALIRYKSQDTPLTLAAKQSHLGRVFLDWAQYPYLEVQPLGDPGQPHNSLVRFYDLRFAYTGLRRSTLGAWVEVTPDLRIVAENFDTRRFNLRGLQVNHR